MKISISIFCTALFLSGCDLGSTPTPTEEGLPLQFAANLRAWSLRQPQPFVVASVQGVDLVTNITFDPVNVTWQFHDSLFIDSANAIGLGSYLTQVELSSLIDSTAIPLTEAQMASLLSRFGLLLRMMRYDSLTYSVHAKMLQWAQHQYPPKTISSGYRTFVYQGPNSGGYSPPVFRYAGVQNLQYFTRLINQTILNNIAAELDTSLTQEQLVTALSPIAQIQIHDTNWGPE